MTQNIWNQVIKSKQENIFRYKKLNNFVGSFEIISWRTNFKNDWKYCSENSMKTLTKKLGIIIANCKIDIISFK